MKEFIFISDFDGTLTDRDFYQMVMDRFPENKGKDAYKRWVNEEIGVFEFLDNVFNSINRSEEEIYQTILEVPFDKYAKGFIDSVKRAGGDFIVLSAGTRYYIDRLFKHYGIEDVNIISNKGEYKDGAILMTADKGTYYYNDRYGIDKGLVVENYKKEYKKVYFAGDSEPDTRGAAKADVVFARSHLKKLLTDRNIPFIGVDNFNDIGNHLNQMGVIQYENKL